MDRVRDSGHVRRSLVGAAFALVAMAGEPAAAASAPQTHANPVGLTFAAGTPAAAGLGPLSRLPLAFEANRGQAEGDVRFVARVGAYRMLLTGTDVVLDLRTLERPRGPVRMARSAYHRQLATSAPVGGQVRMRLVGASPATAIEALEPRPGRVTYTMGRSLRREFDAPTFGRIRYAGVYPGVDLVYYGTGHTVEYDFVVAPGASPASIAVEFEGAESLRLDRAGHLVLRVGGKDFRQKKPVVYQEIDGIRRPVAARYVLRDGRRVAFDVAAYEASRPLVIDPVIELGPGSEGVGDAIAADAAGNSFVGGLTVPAVPQGPFDVDAFVVKLDSAGAVVWQRVFGGARTDFVNGLTVDAAGDVIAVGGTNSSDFPVLNAAQTLFGGDAPLDCGGAPCTDAFVVKLAGATGATLFSTYLGGDDQEFAMSAATDGANRIYVTGGTSTPPGNAVPFPLTSPAQATYGGGPSDAFAAFYSPTGALLYSSYYGGNGDESGFGIAVHAATGQFTITGETFTPPPDEFTPDPPPNDFPTLFAFQLTYGGGVADGFYVRFLASGALRCASYLGGNDDDFGVGAGSDANGSVYLTGNTNSVTGTVRSLKGGYDIYLGKWSPACVPEDPDYIATLGGGGDDFATGIAVTSTGDAYVTGLTTSPSFVGMPEPPPGEPSPEYVFATLLAAGPTPPTPSTIAVGESVTGSLQGIAVDPLGNVYIAGVTESALGIKIEEGAFPPAPGGGLLVSIDIKPHSDPNSINPGSGGMIPVAILSTASFDAPAQVDPASLTFGATGAEASLAFCNLNGEDVNGDGFLDLVCHFSTSATGFQAGDTQGILRGRTVDDAPVVASDAVRIVPSAGGGPTGGGSRGNNGVGNGLDPQPPGNPPVNDGPGTSPGKPGNKK